MASLTLQGITVPVASFGEVEPLRLGALSRATSGQAVSSQRKAKRRFAGTLTPLGRATAKAWEGLISGRGQVASFDVDLLSNRGHSPTTTTDAAVSAVAKVHGAKSLALTAPTGTLVLPFGPSEWTAAFHRNEGGVWVHWVVDSGGGVWINGVASGASSAWLTVAASSTTLATNGASGTEYFDDFALLPFLAPDSWAASIYAEHTARPWTAPPSLRASGDLMPSALEVVSRITGQETAAHWVDGSLDRAAKTLSFELEEA